MKRKFIGFYVSLPQARQLRSAAQAQGRSLSSYLRQCLFFDLGVSGEYTKANGTRKENK